MHATLHLLSWPVTGLILLVWLAYLSAHLQLNSHQIGHALALSRECEPFVHTQLHVLQSDNHAAGTTGLADSASKTSPNQSALQQQGSIGLLGVSCKTHCLNMQQLSDISGLLPVLSSLVMAQSGNQAGRRRYASLGVHELQNTRVVAILDCIERYQFKLGSCRPRNVQQSCRPRQRALLKQLLEQVSQQLHAMLLDRQALGFPLIRRLALGSLWKARAHSQHVWNDYLDTLYKGILLRLYLLHLDTTRLRGQIEFMHVSKAGGTSMCAVAQKNKCINPHFDEDGNCMIPAFRDSPKWTVGYDIHVLVTNTTVRMEPLCSYQCPHWGIDSPNPKATCRARKAVMSNLNWNFYSNEFALHGGTAHPADAKACEDLVNVIVLREPESHTLSLMKEILKLYEWFPRGRGVAWQFPANDLSAWRHIAPAAVDNFTLRWLLGRTAFCVPVEGLNDVHLQFGKLKLLSMDVILVLGNDRLNTQVLKWGLGWNTSLADVKHRGAAVPTALALMAKTPPHLTDQQLRALYTASQAVAVLDTHNGQPTSANVFQQMAKSASCQPSATCHPAVITETRRLLTGNSTKAAQAPASLTPAAATIVRPPKHGTQHSIRRQQPPPSLQQHSSASTDVVMRVVTPQQHDRKPDLLNMSYTALPWPLPMKQIKALWPHLVKRKFKVNAKGKISPPKAAVTPSLSPQQLKQLATWNRLDSELVAFGEGLQVLDSALFAAVEDMAKCAISPTDCLQDCSSRWRDSKADWGWWNRGRSDDDDMNPGQPMASCKGRSGVLLWLCNMRRQSATRRNKIKQQDAMDPVNHLPKSTPGESPYDVPSWLLSGNITEQGLLEQQAWNRRASVWLWQQQQAALTNDCGVLGL